jgi:hypothetical protein
MHRTKTLIRTLIATLAIAAIAAPASSARPIDLGVPKPQAPAQSDALTDPKGPVYWSYEYEAPRPREQPVSTAGNDTPWAILGLAVTGACLLVGGAATVGRTRARARRSRVAA